MLIFFLTFCHAIFLFCFILSLYLFILLTRGAKFLKINFNFLDILVNGLQSDNKQKRRKAASTLYR